jgi:hypothetical protein
MWGATAPLHEIPRRDFNIKFEIRPLAWGQARGLMRMAFAKAWGAEGGARPPQMVNKTPAYPPTTRNTL